MTTTTSDSTTTATKDRVTILELIGRLVLLLDARDWSALEQLFTDRVYSDRTSLIGGEPVTLSAAEFVDGWRMDAPCCDVFRLKDGKIQRFDCYPEGSVILSQLGVLPNLGAVLQPLPG